MRTLRVQKKQRPYGDASALDAITGEGLVCVSAGLSLADAWQQMI